MPYEIEGGRPLNGNVRISGAKNAVLPLMAAAIMVRGKVRLLNAPHLEDVNSLAELMQSLGCQVVHQGNIMDIKCQDITSLEPPLDKAAKIRASILITGPLLATLKEVYIPLPGGCAIGTRPIDLHLKGFAQMGAHINWKDGRLHLRCQDKLTGCRVYLDYPSVGATENIMMAAILAKGETVIENAALEPEVVDLAHFLKQAGAKIEGEGTPVIRVRGVEGLSPLKYEVIPDRIEAGTYLLAGAITGGEVKVGPVYPEHLKAVTAKLIESGAHVKEGEREILVEAPAIIHPLNIKTMPYPGFPTDMQPQFMAYLTKARGTSIITETVFENRFMQAHELLRMGADIKIEGRTAVITGVKRLAPGRVTATDLRAGAALVLAALATKGKTVVEKTEHIDRGYEDFMDKFTGIGAKIKRISPVLV